MQNENINQSIAYHQARIKSYREYLASMLDENFTDDLKEITRQRIKENEEIIRELTEKLQ